MRETRTALLLNALYNPNIGGVENSLRAIADELENRGYRVFLVCSDRNYLSSQKLPQREADGSLEIRRYNYPNSTSGYIRQFLHCRRVIRELIREGCYFDLVISRSPITTIASFISGIWHTQFLVSEIALFKYDLRQILSSPRDLLKYVSEVATQWLALIMARNNYVFSELMEKQLFYASVGVRHARRVSPGVDTKRFHALSPQEKLAERERLGLPVERKISLVLGRFSEIKRFDLAIEASALLDERHLLLLVGDGPELENYHCIINKLNASNRIRIVAATKFPEMYYRVADQFLMTSRYESFGQVLLEATASGLPVISLPGGMKEHTATRAIYASYPSLISYSMTNSPEDLALAMMDRTSTDAVEFDNQRRMFLHEYSWSTLVENLGAK